MTTSATARKLLASAVRAATAAAQLQFNAFPVIGLGGVAIHVQD
jgi:hypothetical protein